jgi:dTDP-4-dehydrorhamnose 3,5-epimerase
MKLLRTPLAGLLVIEPQPTHDARGAFARMYCAATLAEAGIAFAPLQMSQSSNHRAGTLRGLHWQAGDSAEQKLVRATRGRVFDVVVDLRPASVTRGRWFGLELDATGQNAVLIPAGMAHGFITLQDDCELLYAMDVPYTPSQVRGARWDDPAFGIKWPRPPTVVAGHDMQWPAYRWVEATAGASA